jgi:hypothetical protein
LIRNAMRGLLFGARSEQQLNDVGAIAGAKQ